MRKIYVVVDKLLTAEDSWETNLTSLLQGYVEAADIKNVIIEEVSELSTIKTYFETRYITSKDTFIFTNAWSSIVPYIKHWSELYKVPAKLIGFWSKGCFVNSDTEFRPMNERTWRKMHENSNFRCLDKSFFLNSWYLKQFQEEIARDSFLEKMQICKFPLDYLSLELSLVKERYYKQDMIIFPWSNYSKFNEQIVYDFKRIFKKTQVIFAQETTPLTRFQLINQMSKAKIALLPYMHPNIGQEIYECFLLEIIPVVPDHESFRELVPEEFRYPPEWTATIFDYCKYAPDFSAKVKNLLEEYDTLKPLLKEQQDKLTEHYFDSEQIIREIFG
jgi:hypothetical protein